jgi:multiple sugar transport system ATP-binding protein
MAALSIRALSKRYANLEVLKGIDLDIESGEFTVLVGPSGCGKSTLLNIVAGLDRPSAGTVEIGGRIVNDIPPKDRDIAMVFQSYALYPSMTVRQNITFGMECRHVPRAEQEAALTNVARLLQIEPLLGRKPSQLSGGQRQRVAMGRALVRDPLLFLFDEPLSNLDAKLRVEMRMEIKRLHQRIGATIVYVTHDQIEAMTMATRIAVMHQGEVQQFADPDTVYRYPANLFVARFMGSPPMNTMPARLEAEDGGPVVVMASGRNALQRAAAGFPAHRARPSSLMRRLRWSSPPALRPSCCCGSAVSPRWRALRRISAPRQARLPPSRSIHVASACSTPPRSVSSHDPNELRRPR